MYSITKQIQITFSENIASFASLIKRLNSLMNYLTYSCARKQTSSNDPFSWNVSTCSHLRNIHCTQAVWIQCYLSEINNWTVCKRVFCS